MITHTKLRVNLCQDQNVMYYLAGCYVPKYRYLEIRLNA
jgi:hypothetical protein